MVSDNAFASPQTDGAREALAVAGIGIFAIDIAAGRVRYSPELSAMLGIPSVAEATLDAAFARIHRDDVARIRTLYAATLDPAGNGRLRMELRFVRPGGEVRWLSWSGLTRFADIAGERRAVEVIGACVDITQLRLTEIRYRESETRLQRAQEIAHLGSWELDPKNGSLTWSDETYRIFGLTPHETKPSYEVFLDAVHPDDRERVDLAFKDSLARNAQAYEIEHRIVRPTTGEIRIVHAKCEHIRDASGRVVRSLGMVHDITDRKQAEMRLTEREERFRALSAMSSDWFWEQNEHFRFVQISESVESHAGSQPATHFGKTRWELPFVGVSEYDWARHRAMLERHEPFRNLEYQRISDQGDPIWMSVSGDPIFDADGRFRGYRGTGTNITARKEAERRLAEREALLRSVTDNARVGLWLIDHDDIIRYANPAWLALIGLDPATEVIGHPMREIIGDARYGSLLPSIERARAGETVTTEREGTVDVSTGPIARHRMATLQAMPNGPAGESRVIGVVVDITDRRQREERIQRLNRELDHRVRNILARFQVVVARSARSASTTAEFVAALEERIESMARAHALLSRTQWSGVALADLAQDQIEPYQHGAVRLEGPEITLVPEVAQAISMVLHELVTNAAKHGALSRETGRIALVWHIAADPKGGAMLVLDWRECGGPPTTIPDHEGYGVTLIRELVAYELAGTVDLSFAPTGLECCLRLALSRAVAGHHRDELTGER